MTFYRPKYHWLKAEKVDCDPDSSRITTSTNEKKYVSTGFLNMFYEPMTCRRSDACKNLALPSVLDSNQPGFCAACLPLCKHLIVVHAPDANFQCITCGRKG